MKTEIMRAEIINALEKRGCVVEAKDVVKNGVTLHGILFITDTNTCPIFYTEGFLMDEVDVAAEKMIFLFKQNQKDINVNDFTNKEFLLKHIYIGLQRAGDEPLVKKAVDKFEGMEQYLYIKDRDYSTRVSETLLKEASISLDEAWDRALENTNKEAVLESVAKFVSTAEGIEYREEMDEDFPFFILSNHERFRGASAILNKEVLREFAKRFHVEKIVVIPSSVHEVLILPYTEEFDFAYCSFLVNMVNDKEVNPIEQLGDKAYVIPVGISVD